MPTGSISIAANIAGSNILKSISKTADHPQAFEVDLPVGTDVSSWAKTDADTGVATMSAGHGLTNGTYDAYWSGGCRFGLTGTFAGDDLTLDGGAGDDFPASSTAMVVCKQVEINTAIDGDNVQIFACCAEYASTSEDSPVHVDFQDSGSASIHDIDLVANEPSTWWADSGVTNPFTGNPIVDCFASNGSTENVATLKILTLEDSTP